jgi:two-component system OmpR family response regulator
MDGMASILLIEDDLKVAHHVASGLSDAGHVVHHCADGREGLLVAAASQFDAIVLDRMLPKVEGMKVLQALRSSGDATPVLILSALADVDERVAGLSAGGDDYLAKPFALAELCARVEALLRRRSAAGDFHRLSIADLEMDLPGRIVRRAGRRLDLTEREFRILELLVRHAGRVVTRSMLIERVWDYHFDPQTNIIDQHVSRLRQKLEHDAAVPLITTVRGVGYVIRKPE